MRPLRTLAAKDYNAGRLSVSTWTALI